MARSVMAETSALRPYAVGQLVDAFLADHGGVHVRQEQALAPPVQGLHHHVDGPVPQGGAQERLDGLGVGRGGDDQVRGDSPCQNGAFRFLSQRPRGHGHDLVRENRPRRVGDQGRHEGALGGRHGRTGVREVRVGAVLIAGPTASGKSALGVRLAQALDGVVINADSMQVYRTCGC
jgi:hypothetical protein